MPYVVLEDVGTTRRRSLSTRRRLQAWERTHGTCVVCGTSIDAVRERWIVEHVRALELGGSDELENMGPAHERCAIIKTRDDNARTARAKRQKIQHLGAGVTRSPLPGSRGTPYKKTLNGRVVLREEPSKKLRATRVTPDSELKSLTGDDTLARSPAACPAHQTPGIVAWPTSCESEGPKTVSKKPSGAPRTATADSAAAKIDEAPRTIAPHLSFLFDETPLLSGENPDLYKSILDKIIHEIRPNNVIDAIYVKDVVDLIWESRRLRLWKKRILHQARFEAAQSLIAPLIVGKNRTRMSFELEHADEDETREVVTRWLTEQQDSSSEFADLLHLRGSTPEEVMAAAFRETLPEIEKIDRMAAAADTRRDALLQEIERRRMTFGQKLRAASDQVLDLEPASLPNKG